MKKGKRYIVIALALTLMGRGFPVSAGLQAIRYIALDGPLTMTKNYVTNVSGTMTTPSGKVDYNEKFYSYTIKATESNIVAGASGVVLGKTAYADLRSGAGDGALVKSTNTTATNLKNLDIELSKMGNESVASGSTEAITVTSDTTTGADGVQKTTYTLKANTGEIRDGLGTLVTGGTLYNETHLDAGTYNYIDTSNNAGKNLAALDNQIEKNRAQIFEKNKVDIEGLTKMTNITEEGKTVLKGLIQNGIQVVAGDERMTVNHMEDGDGNLTYIISAQTGAVAKGLNQLVTGGTIYNELLVAEDGTYIRSSDNVATNLMTLDAQVKMNADDIFALNQKIGDKIEMITADLSQIGASAAALAALHPETFESDDKWSLAVGYGHYRSQNAAALGIYFKPGADITFSIGGTVWGGDSLLNMSTSFKLGSRGKAIKVQTNQEIQAIAMCVSALEEKETKQKKKMDAFIQRIEKMEMNKKLCSERITKLEADGKILQERHARQVMANGEMAKKIAKLKVDGQALRGSGVDLRLEKEKMKAQMMIILGNLEMGEGDIH